MGTWKGFDNSACVEQRITNACFPCRAHASNYIPESPKQIHTQNHFEFQQEGSWNGHSFYSTSKRKHHTSCLSS